MSFVYDAHHNFEANVFLIISGLLVVVISITIARYLRSPWRKVPPRVGPPGLPLLGSALQLTGNQWLAFAIWGKLYGDVVYLSALGQPMVILNSHKAASDLLDRRAAIYSDRGRNIVAGEILTGGMSILFNGYNDIWKRMRRAAHEGLGKVFVTRYHPIQAQEALLLTKDILAEPDLWEKHIGRATSSSIMTMVYGTPVIESQHDKSIIWIEDMANRLIRAAMPGAHLVEFLPILKLIPSRFAKWKRDAEAWYLAYSKRFESLFEEACDRVTQGLEHATFSNTLSKHQDRGSLSVRENAWLAAAMYAAGSETTAAVMSWWMLAMMRYPETQTRAQAEIDAVVGRDRLPTFKDFEHLPYVRAMVKEALRWRPVDPLAFPHRLSQDDWYEGHFIPKGTIVIGNVWQICRDPAVYGLDADEFNPARYLDSGSILARGAQGNAEDNHPAFGFGRRICVGRHIAINSLFIDIATILWAMNIEQPLDEDGNPQPLDIDGCINKGSVVVPNTFECKISPRSPDVLTILQHAQELY